MTLTNQLCLYYCGTLCTPNVFPDICSVACNSVGKNWKIWLGIFLMNIVFLHNLEKQAGFINFEGSRHLPYVNRDDTLLSITHSSYSTMLLHCYTTPLCHIMYYSLLSFNPLSSTLIIRLLGRSFSLAWIFFCKYLKIILISSYLCNSGTKEFLNKFSKKKKFSNLPPVHHCIQ